MEENSTNASRSAVAEQLVQVRRRRHLGGARRRRCSSAVSSSSGVGVDDAGGVHAPRSAGRSARTATSSAASASRSATSHGADRDPRAERGQFGAPARRRPGAVRAPPAGSTRWSAPWPASQRATCAPSAPVPPVTRTVPRGCQGRPGAGGAAGTQPAAEDAGGADRDLVLARRRRSAPAASSRPSTGPAGRSTRPPQRSGCSRATTRPRPQTAAPGVVGAPGRAGPAATAPLVDQPERAVGAARTGGSARRCRACAAVVQPRRPAPVDVAHRRPASGGASAAASQAGRGERVETPVVHRPVGDQPGPGRRCRRPTAAGPSRCR